MEPTDAAWMAGIMDGEGSFMIRRGTSKTCTYWTAVIAVSSTDPRIVHRCRELAGGGTIAVVAGPGGNAKCSGIWSLKGPRLGVVITAIRPFIITKSEQIDILVELRGLTIRRGSRPGEFGRKTNPEIDARKQMLALAVRALNHRGTSEIPRDRVDALHRWRDERLNPEYIGLALDRIDQARGRRAYG